MTIFHSRSNIYFSDNFEKEFQKRGILFDGKIEDVWSEIFDDYFDQLEYIEKRDKVHIIEYEPLMAERLIGSMVEKRFEETILENVSLFESMISYLKEFNPQIVILSILLPHYYFMEKTEKYFMETWKSKFYDIMSKMINKYGIDFLDLKDEESVSRNFRFYRDSGHLNIVRGMAIISILDNYLSNKYTKIYEK